MSGNVGRMAENSEYAARGPSRHSWKSTVWDTGMRAAAQTRLLNMLVELLGAQTVKAVRINGRIAMK